MVVLYGVLASASFSSAQADAIFDFDDISEETPTTFSDTQNGITATFSSPGDPGGFGVLPISGPDYPLPLSGNVIINPVQGGDDFSPLFAAFDTPLFGTSLDFILNEESSSGFTLQAFSGGIGGTLIGTSQTIGVVPVGGTYAQGSISFNSALAFDTLRFDADTAPNFGVDNLSVSTSPEPSPVPEPGTIALMGVGLASLAAARRRKKELLNA